MKNMGGLWAVIHDEKLHAWQTKVSFADPSKIVEAMVQGGTAVLEGKDTKSMGSKCIADNTN